MPVAVESPATGAPSAPKATGAVLAISDSAEEASGEKPSPIMIWPVTATGVPKPDAPSKKAPKAKAIKRSCNRRSGVTSPIERRMMSNQPRSSVSR